MIQCFQLGYSPADRHFLYSFLSKKGYSQDFLDKCGLFSSRYSGVPLFAGRLMFPISDRQGRVVAFGGRILPENETADSPKYINSPELEIFKKGQTLFAIDIAIPFIRQTKTVYLAEGYMDVIALHQAEIVNSVAPLGTAFTDEQAAWLRRWVENVVLIFDSDEAGQKAAYKAIITCRKNGISCSLVNLQEGLESEIDGKEARKIKDPADILQKFGHQILKKVVKFTINDFEYLISRGRLQYSAADGDINRAVEFMFPFLEALDSEIDRDDSITRVADIFKIERSAVQKEYSNWKTTGYKDFSEKPVTVKPKLQIRRNAELSLLTTVAINQELYPDFRAALEIKDVDDPTAKELFIVLEECFKNDESGTDSLLKRISDEALRAYVAESGTSGEFKGDSRKFMEDGIKQIRKKRLEKRLTEINAQMREDERKFGDVENIDELLAEKKSIDSQIRKLEGR